MGTHPIFESDFDCLTDQSKMGKPRGIRCARKMRNRRRDQRWADLGYKKANLGTALKANPFGGASHAKGIVLEKIGVEAKQPNSAIRKCVRVQLIKNGKKKSPPSCPMTVASTTSRRTTRCSLPDLVALATPLVIFPAFASRSSKSPMCRCWRCSTARRSVHDRRSV